MRVMIAQNILALPIRGGANKVTGALARALVERGHQVRLVARSFGSHAQASRDEFLAMCARLSIAVQEMEDADVFVADGVEVHAVDARRLGAVVKDRVRDADLVVVAAEDPGQALLKAVLDAATCPVAYLVQTTATLPFGPGAFSASPRGTTLVKRASLVVTTQFLAAYVRRWADVEPVMLPVVQLPFDPDPPPLVGSPDNAFVTMINPCAVKGLSLLLDIAARRPATSFAAVPTWGATSSDRAAMQALPNITLLEPTDDIDTLYRRTRVLLVPSLWDEAFGLVALEAMLRGVPVLASDVGGLPEAMRGCDYVLPVRPITKYEARIDERGLPVPVIEPQDVAPWLAALDALEDRGRHERMSADARRAALGFLQPRAAADDVERGLVAIAAGAAAGSRTDR